MGDPGFLRPGTTHYLTNFPRKVYGNETNWTRISLGGGMCLPKSTNVEKINKAGDLKTSSLYIIHFLCISISLQKILAVDWHIN